MHPGRCDCQKEKLGLGLFLAASDNPKNCFRAECFLAAFIVLSTWGNQLSGGLILLEGINTAAFPQSSRRKILLSCMAQANLALGDGV